MPLIFRSMQMEGNRPRIGSTATSLGVRVPPDKKPDIVPDAAESVEPGRGGMSVVPAWRLLPFFRIPRRLKPIMPAATGSNSFSCWRMGEGLFAAGEVFESFALRPDPDNPVKHGFVEPAARMSLVDYRAALAATKCEWVIDET